MGLGGGHLGKTFFLEPKCAKGIREIHQILRNRPGAGGGSGKGGDGTPQGGWGRGRGKCKR